MRGTPQLHTLTASNLIIRPTRWGILYVLMTIALLLTSINYSVSLGYYLSFLMMGLSIIAILHTWQNLTNLEIDSSLLTTPVFTGETALINIKVINKKPYTRYAIHIKCPSHSSIVEDVPANSETLFSIPVETTKRGWLHLSKLTIFSEFPLGLFRVSSALDSPVDILVYASPEPHLDLPKTGAGISNNSATAMLNNSGDEFNGHRAYQTSDPIQHIDWKASSRSSTLVTKQYVTNQTQTIWLDWSATEGLPLERRISRLTYAVIAASNAHLPYGLKLPNTTYAPSTGLSHHHQCLQALALL
jgi:uncharacterized protein (DUF58 family)